jgi:hypothetical protein
MSFEAVAEVRTSRADRYLAQLCDHIGHLQHETPSGAPDAHHHSRGDGHSGGHDSQPEVRGVVRSGNRAEIDFDWGHCVLTAFPDVLTVRLRAEDAPALAFGQQLLAGRIETIGRRDQLTVTWQTTDPS